MCRLRHPLTLTTLFALLALVALVGSTPRHSPAAKSQVQASYARLPLSFEANQGQADGQVRFLSRGAGYSLFLTGTEAVLSLRGPEGRKQKAVGRRQRSAVRPNTQHPTPTTLRMKLAGANPKPAVRGVERLPGVSNYFLGNDPKLWRTNVPHYAKVRYEEVYPGIDLVYYGNQQHLECDFVVAPGADPDQVRLSFEGAERVELDAAGDLLLQTPGGTVRQHKPVAYQEAGNRREAVDGEYRLLADGRVGFALGAYDTARPLVIDPVLTYATSLGGSGSEMIFGMAVDGAGAVYLAGETGSADFPVVGAVQPDPGGGAGELFVSKINPAGTALVYSTYLGGSGYDQWPDIAVDTAGSAYVCGSTNSSNFPTTPDAFDTTYELEGGPDAFVARLSAAGDVLVYSTYLGGSSGEQFIDIAVDVSGAAYVTGQTYSLDFPVTPGAYQPSRGGTDRSTDVFVTRLAPTGSSLLYSTYLGGDSHDSSWSVAVDGSGCAYVTGSAGSADFPVTPGSFDTTWTGVADGFVTKLNQTGTNLIYSTFLEGAQPRAITVDAAGSAHVAGEAGDGFSTTPGAFQSSPGSQRDAFVLKLNPSGSAFVYSTFLGGAGVDEAWGIAVNRTGSAHVTGSTESSDFPLWQPLQPSRAGPRNAFVTGLTPDGSSLTFSTHLGGGQRDLGWDIGLDASAAIYVAGGSWGGFPTAHPLQPFRGDSDGFLAKIRLTEFPPPTNLIVRAVSPYQAELSWTDNSSDETSFRIEHLDRDISIFFSEFGSTGSNVTRFTDTTVRPLSEPYIYRVRAVGPAGHSGYTNHAAIAMGLLPPTALTAVRYSDAQAQLAWRDESLLETHFLIERKAGFPADPGAYTEVARTRANTPTLVLAAPDPGVHTFRVRAAIVYAGGTERYSLYSNEATVNLLGAPSELTAAALSGSEIRLNWRDNSTVETGFRIERRSGSGAFVEVGTVAAGITSYVDSGLADLTAYGYRVRAYTGSFLSPYSNGAAATTLLNPPTGLAGAPLSGRRVRLTWDDRSVRESGYQIERKTGTGAFALAGTTDANATSFTDAGLTPLTAYTYRVRAVNSASTSVYSNEATVTTLADVPEPPSALALTVSTGIVQLRWSDNSTNETGFKVERRTGTGGYAEVAVLPAGSTAFTDRGLTGGGTYTYRVRAYNASGNSLYSNEATAVLTGPPAPSNAVATALWGTRIRLTWQDNSSGEYGFRIERKTGTGSFAEVRVVSSNVTELLDTGLNPGTQHTYRVRAYNGLGTSAYSNEAAATTPAPPAAPTSLTATAVSSTRIRLAWQDRSTNESGFRLERRSGTGNWVEFRTLPANGTAFEDQRLPPGTGYTYRVRAYGPGGMSSYSNEAPAATPP